MKQMRGSAGGDVLLFIVFIIALGVIWAITGGPERTISRSGPFLPSIFGTEGFFGVPNVSTSSHTIGVGVPGNGGGTIGDFSKRFINLREGEERSPYAEHVTLSVSTAKQSDPGEEYVTIKVAPHAVGTMTISDWRLESEKSERSVILGPAAQLAQVGQISVELPVAIGANATVYVVSGRSPIGTSFRVNTCSGYLEQFQDFKPPLSIECPFPLAELQEETKRNPSFQPSNECGAYVAGLEQCTYHNTPLPGSIDAECQNIILNNLAHNGCTALHANDVGFYKNEWRLFLEQDTELWAQTNERIRLIDEAGRVIDVVSY